MKGAVSSVDLHALVNEMQFLIGGKVQKIYQPQRELFYFELHAPGKGKQVLRVIPGKLLNLGSEKFSAGKPSGMAMFLRKYLSNARLISIKQHGSERIVVIDFEGEIASGEIVAYHLIVEFFSKGNLVFCDKDWKVMTLLDRQVRESRSVTHKVEYKFPPAQLNWKELEEEKFVEIISKTEKRNLATCIATEIGIGGLYAEEICNRVGVDPKIISASLSDVALKKLYKEFKELLSELEKPRGYVYTKERVPVKLSLSKVGDLAEQKDSFHETLVGINPLVKESPYEKKIANVKRIIERQEKIVADVEGGIEKASQAGEKIYSEYVKVQALIDQCNGIAAQNGWASLKKELKGLDKIKQVDLKKKILTVEL